MVEPVAHPKRSWGRVLGRFVLALVLIMISGSARNAGLVGYVPDLVAIASLVALVWAVLGLRRTR
jgi:hypothetical protein